MIGKVVKGKRVAGLLHYLFGPGRANEHTNPHLVASWDGALDHLEPGTKGDGRRDVTPLARLLNQPLDLLKKKPDKAVWHCSLRVAPTDRKLTDAEWATVARQVVERTGLAKADDPAGCRWVAVRHADDHIHLVVTLARQDGRRPSTSNDFHKLGQACQWAESQYGLTKTAPRDRTANKPATRAERERTARQGRTELSRPQLRSTVQSVAALAQGPDDFVKGLRDAGLLVRLRYSQQNPDQITGYAVAMPGDRAASGDPIWYGGGKLASDLTWPKLIAGWTSGSEDRVSRGDANQDPIRQASQAARDAALELRRPKSESDANSDALIQACGLALHATARLIEGRRPASLTRAADVFQRAARVPYARCASPSTRARPLVTAARALAHANRGTHADPFATNELVAALVVLTRSAAIARQRQRRFAQADAARAATLCLQATGTAVSRQHVPNRTQNHQPDHAALKTSDPRRKILR